MGLFSTISGFWGRFSGIADAKGSQQPAPSMSLVPGATHVGVDGAMQLSTVWACIDRRATTIASLPFFAYDTASGQKKLARLSRLYELLHESPNSRMTPFEFWRCMVMNHDLRGNAYARLDRTTNGEVSAMWPMAADQVECKVLDDGVVVYHYNIDGNVAVFAQDSVLHLKNLGNGTSGLSKLDYMRASIDEAAKAQTAASQLFGSGGKPTGILMVDRLLTKEHREIIKKNFSGLAEGSTSRLLVLESDMKYSQLSMTPEDQQLLETRQFSVEEICRWFDVPPVMVHHSNVTAWGSGIEQIVDGFYKLTVRPMLVSIEQATRKRVMTNRQRASMVCEFSLDALLRGSLKDRMDIYAKATQNGIKTRNECRQLENDPPMDGGDELTAQSNLVPVALLGKINGGGNVSTQDPIAN